MKNIEKKHGFSESILSKNDPKIVPKLSQNHQKIIPKKYKNDPKHIKK